LGATSLISADAQKFKTKFEECRKEIEEKEKKGAAGLWVGALQTHSAPSRSPRRVLFPSATGTCGGCDLCPVTGSTATPVHGCFLGVGWLCLPGAVGAWGGACACLLGLVLPPESRAHARLETLGHGRLLRLPLTSPLCPPGSGKNDSTEKVVEKLEALSVQEGEQPQDAAPAAVEEEQ